MRIAIKEVGKPLEIREVTDVYRGDCCRNIIDVGDWGTVEYVRMSHDGTMCMAVDEDGLMKRLPLNFLFASNNPHFPIQKIVGTAVFVRTKYVNVYEQEVYDYEVDNLTDDDIKVIEGMLGEKEQSVLGKMFSDYGHSALVYETFRTSDEFFKFFMR